MQQPARIARSSGTSTSSSFEIFPPCLVKVLCHTLQHNSAMVARLCILLLSCEGSAALWEQVTLSDCSYWCVNIGLWHQSCSEDWRTQLGRLLSQESPMQHWSLDSAAHPVYRAEYLRQFLKLYQIAFVRITYLFWYKMPELDSMSLTIQNTAHQNSNALRVGLVQSSLSFCFTFF